MAGPRFSIINTAAVGDVNGDGKQDMVYIRTVSASAYFLDVRTNDGTGQFTQTSLTGASELESSIRLGDVNGDGKLDVLMGNIFTGTLDVRLGNGDGTFAAATKYATGGQHWRQYQGVCRLQRRRQGRRDHVEQHRHVAAAR